MPTNEPTRRRWFQFGLASLLVLVTVCALFLGWRVNRRPPAPPSILWTPEDVQALIAHINGPPKAVGFIKNVQVPSADRLGAIGPPAKQYGAVDALNALIAKTADPDAKKAAQIAIKKINAGY